MNICLLGNNLTNLVLANILLKKKIDVDIVSQYPNLPLKKTNRTIAISDKNYEFLSKNIKGFSHQGWPTKKIKIYSDKNSSTELFKFQKKNENNFYLFKYVKLYKLLKKINF